MPYQDPNSVEYANTLNYLSSFLQSNYSTDQDLAGEVIAQLELNSDNDPDISSNANREYLQNILSAIRTNGESLQNATDIVLGLGSGLAKDVAASMKPSDPSKFLLKYDLKTGTYAPSPAASNYYAVSNLGKAVSKALVPLAVGFAGARFTEALIHNEPFEAGKISAQTGAAILGGLIAASLVPVTGGLAAAGVGILGAAIMSEVAGKIYDLLDPNKTFQDVVDETLQEMEDFFNNIDSWIDDALSNAQDFFNKMGLGLDNDNDGRSDAQPEMFGPFLPEDPNMPQRRASPLVLDLDGDGIEVYAKGAYGTFFDLRGNGQAVLTGWVAPDDGLLALDINENGVIDGASELFGSLTTDGFSVLATHDTNNDGVINASDAVFASLLVWTDLNSDGISQENELHTLGDLDITSISLNATRNAVNDNENKFFGASTARLRQAA